MVELLQFALRIMRNIECIINNISYESFHLTDIQWRFASAIAQEDNLKEPLAISFIKKYDLPSSSTLQRALDSLLKKELVIFYKNSYRIYDVFFSHWLKNNLL